MSLNVFVDFGCVNLCEGVVLGFNFMDFFKVGVLCFVVLIDFESLCENWFGSVMMCG